MRHLVVAIIIILGLTLVIPAGAHENEEFKHGSTGMCFGWRDDGLTRRMCYTNVEQTTCKTILHNHGLWHVTEEFECPTEEGEKD